jgi:hypothetical protein
MSSISKKLSRKIAQQQQLQGLHVDASVLQLMLSHLIHRDDIIKLRAKIYQRGAANPAETIKESVSIVMQEFLQQAEDGDLDD